jgi:7 transmembrane helices usually fused to an inactive transglutaminase
MSRTALCACTAAAVTLITLAVMAARIRAMRDDSQAAPSIANRIFHAASTQGLSDQETHLVELLLLFPVAALVIAVFRNVIGLSTFGTFTPALLGLAFRDPSGWPGMLVFVAIVLGGWLLRRLLDRFHLLQVPRVSVMLCVVVSLVAVVVVASRRLGLDATRHVSLFPLVILTGMVERLWTLEEEDGARASLRTLFTTLLVAACVALIVGRPSVIHLVTTFPESIGLIAAALLLLGRYTGYRLTELHRFRDFLREPVDEVPDEMWDEQSSFSSSRY